MYIQVILTRLYTSDRHIETVDALCSTTTHLTITTTLLVWTSQNENEIQNLPDRRFLSRISFSQARLAYEVK